ncbi:hypothetical protein DEJ50_04325 [Streptomyces venezuelae]|uniref:Uncharacterized protein n=1 Tax=Streptomyces venezuelae TaxID=54571 RepID=A0A5P2CW99_STRVZ|nr:hypothetical protein [Streptomyces venezuelae]QES47182.1 hypothetical protein DEJ50_04325 [Streptomyces venezuelae]
MAARKGCLIGCGVALVVGTGLIAALVFGAVKVLDAADKTVVDPAVYEALQVGQPEAEVRGRLPSGETFLKSALKEGGPAQPEGTQCSWFISGADSKVGEESVYRFCYRNGTLAEKVQYRL